MKVSKEQVAKNRKTILETAARLFRENGIERVGVDRLMTETGLTHGCLYSQFDSREVLVEEACRYALETSVTRWKQRASDESIPDARAAIVERYLSQSHRDHPGDGCLLSTLVSEIAKQSDPVRHVFTMGLKQLAAVLEQVSHDQERQLEVDTLSTLSLMVGAVVLARAVDDPGLSNQILRSAEVQLLPKNAGRTVSKQPGKKKLAKSSRGFDKSRKGTSGQTKTA